jgi:signal transduction histidine kinase/CheY-like chemotaxis protein
MQIRAYLFLMAAGILVPVIVFSGLALGMLQNAEKEAALRGLSETAHGVALLVDRELYSAEAALRVLASSPSLAHDDIPAFYEQAKAASRGPDGWTLLLGRQGEQIINTRVPLGAALPVPIAKARVERVIATQRTVVSNVIAGPTRKQLVTTLNVPVPFDGGKRYVLATAFTTGHFNSLIASAPVPDGWLIAIIDGDGRFIARNINTEQLVGEPARPELVAAARRSHEGQIRHLTLEGTEAYDVFTHSSLSGWTIAVAAPVALIDRSARHASLVAALGLLAAMLCAVALAAFFGRLHVHSIRRAVAAAIGLGNGIPPGKMQSRVAEMNELHTALHRAGEQLVQARAYRRNAEAEREALLEREQKARAMAEQQNMAKDQFLAMLGHELRNPLAPISTAAQLLKLPAIDENRVRYASDVIARQVDHMNRLLGDMLDVSRVTRGLVSLSIEQLDLKAVIERAVEQAHSLIETKQHRLELRLPARPVPVRGDQTRLIQIFSNLLNNAAKYTPPHGHICLTVMAEADDEPVVVTVQDNGEGFSAELLPRIFDLFSQGERAPDRAQGGLGLGLALVKSLAQLHGGTVAALSPGPGKGSTFSVSLPWRAEPAAPGAARERLADAARSPLRVMIVDDNIDGASSLSLFLQAAGGHHVSTYYDASGALEWAEHERPDVFILDIGLPDITGYELAQRLRAIPRFAHTTLIALTGYGQPQDKERARAAGFDYHVAKPAEPGRILALLDACAGRATVGEASGLPDRLLAGP